MYNSSFYRSNLSNEKIDFLSAIKEKDELNIKDDNAPKIYKRTESSAENDAGLEVLWQGMKSNRDEKSPGIYLLIGFITGALCVFVLNSLLNVHSDNISDFRDSSVLNSPQNFEKKIPRREKLLQLGGMNTSSEVQTEETDEQPYEDFSVSSDTPAETPVPERYTVKSGDSISTIVIKLFGKYDVNKIEQIKRVNNLPSVNKLKIGQELIIPAD